MKNKDIYWLVAVLITIAWGSQVNIGVVYDWDRFWAAVACAAMGAVFALFAVIAIELCEHLSYE